jgi:hypothetical protein
MKTKFLLVAGTKYKIIEPPVYNIGIDAYSALVEVDDFFAYRVVSNKKNGPYKFYVVQLIP